MTVFDFTAQDADKFASAEPFPHLVVDGLWGEDDLRMVVEEFPAPDDRRWQQYYAEQERGKKAGGPHMQGRSTRAFMNHLRSADACAALEKLTGIHPLVADELGGGMHLTGEGGRLGVHTDFQRHPEFPGLQRRINLLVFLSPGWDSSWGGVLHLGANREASVVPAWNRTVIFATSDKSWHGHPEPIIGDHVRRSLAVYYYSPAEDGAALADTTAWLA